MNKAKYILPALIFLSGITLLILFLIKGNILQTEESFFNESSFIQKKNSSIIHLPAINPFSFALSKDQTYWVSGEKKLLHISARGDILNEISAANAYSAMVIKERNIIFAAAAQKIVKIIVEEDKTEQQVIASLSDKSFITSMCFSDNILYTADAGEKTLKAFNTEGEELWQTKGQDQFIVPSPYFDVVPDLRGGVWVTNPGRLRLENYDNQGNFKAFWVPEKENRFRGCCNPASLAILPGEKFVTLEKGLIQCRIFSPSGKMEKLVAGKQELLHPLLPANKRPHAAKFRYKVAVDKQNNIIILDIEKKILRKFNLNELHE